MTNIHTLYRTDGPDTSKQAALTFNVTKMEQVVLDVVSKFKGKGCISDEVLKELPDYRYSTITARYKALKDKGLVIIDERKLKGASGRQQHVMWDANYYTGDEQ